jgi:arylsulfatase A-like enzyme
MNIILIMSDTFRRDHLGCYGNPWIHTPHLDRLAEQSVVFDHFYAGSFPTMPNRADLLLGKYSFPSLGWAPLPENETPLGEILTREGYLTAAMVDTPFYIRKGYGWDRGFDNFQWFRGQGYGQDREDVTRDRRYEVDLFGPRTFAAAEQWLELHRKDKFFLLIDTWDPHEPWDPPDYYVELYKPDYDGSPCLFPTYWYYEEAGVKEEDVKTAHAHYCGEVTMVDRAVGRLLERLDSLGIADDTAVLFTSDHGFYFGEHGIFGKAVMKSEHGFKEGPARLIRGEWTLTLRNPETGEATLGSAQWHRSPLYSETTRIPLIAHVPGTRAGRVDVLSSSPDLMPTILELAGVKVPSDVQSASLLPLVDGTQKSLHEFVVTSFPLHVGDLFNIKIVDDVARMVAETLPTTVTTKEWAMISSIEGAPVELYHMPTDPQQGTNVVTDHPQTARELQAKLISFLEEKDTDERLVAPRRHVV